jgi:hypothetical protein
MRPSFRINFADTNKQIYIHIVACVVQLHDDLACNLNIVFERFGREGKNV